MARPIVMPSFGMYTAEGTLIAWREPPGTRVRSGQIIAEIETEKAVQELPAPDSGILHPVAVVGSQIKEEGLLGYILGDGETPPGPEIQTNFPQAGDGSRPPAATASTAPPSSPERTFVKASPIARRLAAEHGVDLANLTGTGPGGRIVEADVLAAVQTGATPADARGPKPAVRARIPLSTMRRTIGRRLRASLDAAVSLTLTREVVVDALVAARNAVATNGAKPPPFDAYFARMLAVALRERPELNAAIERDELILFEDVNIGIAVSLPDGLVVPVIHKVDTLPLAEVAEQIRERANRARSGALRPEELSGGTCTISNLGAAGVDAFTPILDPPQTCILGIGRIQPRFVVREGAPVVAQTAVLSLTFDHRATDGAPAAQVLSTIARLANDAAWLAQLAKAS